MPKKTKNPVSLARKLAKTTSLEDLRWSRDIAKREGKFQLAFTLATAIDIKKGLY